MATPRKHGRSFSILMWVVVLGELSIFSNGCATTPRYRAKASLPIDGAQVRGASEFHWFRHWYKIRLEEVDGEKVNTSFWTNWKKPILIDPGDRVIRVECVLSPDGSRTESLSVDLNVSFLAGHNYNLRCGIAGDSVAFWVEDTETHHKAGIQQLSISPSPHRLLKQLLALPFSCYSGSCYLWALADDWTFERHSNAAA